MDSLAVVLVQALQNNDIQLLDYCFDNEVDILLKCVYLSNFVGYRSY